MGVTFMYEYEQHPNMIKLIINASRIKYAILDELLKLIKIQQSTINFLIDMSCVFRKIYQNKNNVYELFHDTDEFVMDIVVAILNTVAHYRRYLYTRLGKSNRIFLVYNTQIPAFQKSLIANYGEKQYTIYQENHPDFGAMNVAIRKAIHFIQDIVPYIEDVFFIENQKVEELVTMSYIMGCEETKNDFNIILTRNPMVYQMLDKRCITLYPKRDESKRITSDTWTAFEASKLQYNPPAFRTNFVPIFLAIRGIKERNVSSVYLRGVSQIFKLFERLESGHYLGDRFSLQTFLDAIPMIQKNKERLPTDNDIILMKQMYRAFHIPTSVAAMTATQYNTILTSIYNIYDQTSLEQLNELLIQTDDILNLQDLNMAHYINPFAKGFGLYG